MSSYRDNNPTDFYSGSDPSRPEDRDGAGRQRPYDVRYHDHGEEYGDDDDYDGDEYYEEDRRRPANEDGDFVNSHYDDDGRYDDGYDDRYDDDEDGPYEEGDFFEEDFDDDERERKARDTAKKPRKRTKVYEVEDSVVRDDAEDEYGADNPSGAPRRDYWGRERKNCCDCIRLCCLSCCRGFRTPPACEPRRICECPHGWCYTTMGVILGISGLIMCVFYIISCDVERITILYNGSKPPDAPRIGYGFVSRGTTFGEAPSYMSCIYYSDEEKAGVFDIWMHSARFFLFFSTVLGMIGSVVLFTAICVAWSPNTFEHWLMWLYVVAGLTAPLSYLLFGSPLCADNECKLGQGGVQCISIFLFWLCCANTVKSFPVALPPRTDDDDDRYNGEEDDDDLYYETEEDMWNDRRPPRPEREMSEHDETSSPHAMDPQYIDDYADYDNNNNAGAPYEEGYPDGHHDENGNPDYYHEGYPSASNHSHLEDGNHNYDDGHVDNDPFDDSRSTSRPRVGDEDGPTIT